MAEVIQQDIQSTLKKVVRSSMHNGFLAKGLHEVCKGLETADNQKQQFCILAENCDEAQYVKLIKALCKQHSVPLLTIPKGETMGEWIGIAKVDSKQQVRKARKCSSLMVKNYHIDISEEEKKMIADEIGSKK